MAQKKQKPAPMERGLAPCPRRGRGDITVHYTARGRSFQIARMVPMPRIDFTPGAHYDASRMCVRVYPYA